MGLFFSKTQKKKKNIYTMSETKKEETPTTTTTETKTEEAKPATTDSAAKPTEEKPKAEAEKAAATTTEDKSKSTTSDAKEEKKETVEDSGPHFEPLVSLPEVENKHGEEDEDVVFKMRAKLFRFDKDMKEWKERGTGNVRFLKHRETKKIRLLMRREKTLKVCANHLVVPGPKLEPNGGSDRAWVWTCLGDISDLDEGEEPKPELLAIRFANSDDANAFKAKYEECQAENEKVLTKK